MQKTTEDKRRYMTETPIPKLVVSLSIPTTISMLITSFYNMADTFFVGRLNSASATGAVGVIFPMMSIMQAVGFMFGHGSGNYVSRKMGAGDYDDAAKMASTGFFTAFLAGILIMIFGLSCAQPLVYWLGSTETIAPYAQEYLRYLMPGVPFLVSSLVLNNQLRFQGNAFYAMIGITSGALLNVALDPLFIFVFGMGVAGAALATSISQVMGFSLLLYGTFHGGNIRLKLQNFTPNKHYFSNIFKGGLPSLARQGLNSLATIVLNTAAGQYQDAAIAAMSIVTRIMNMAVSALIGFGQGFQPICGFNYGAGLYKRVRQSFWFCVKLGLIVLIIVAIIAVFFAPDIISLFMKDNAEVQAIGSLALRLQCIFVPLFSFTCISNMMLQTMGITGKATILAMARQGLFFIPSVLILEKLFGLTGIQCAQPVADVLSFLLALPLSLSVLSELKEKEAIQISPKESAE